MKTDIIFYEYRGNTATIQIIDHNWDIFSYMPLQENCQATLRSEILNCESGHCLKRNEAETMVNIYKVYFRDTVDRTLNPELYPGP